MFASTIKDCTLWFVSFSFWFLSYSAIQPHLPSPPSLSGTPASGLESSQLSSFPSIILLFLNVSSSLFFGSDTYFFQACEELRYFSSFFVVELTSSVWSCCNVLYIHLSLILLIPACYPFYLCFLGVIHSLLEKRN